MAPNIASAKITLSCPLFAADFDPRNNGFLLVGGGGGEGRSGVGNKIALLDTSKRNEIAEVVDIELSRDEDSVTSLAAAHADDESVVAFAGINSSQKEQLEGNNQHLRSFRVAYPPRKSTAAVTGPEANAEGEVEKETTSASTVSKQQKTVPLSRASLFRNPTTKPAKGQKIDTYQRILRLSPWRGPDAPRIGAVATGLAPSGEIVLFNVTTTPSESDILARIQLGAGEEAEDLDIIDLEDGNFRVAYTDGVQVSIFDISSKSKSNTSPEIRSVYTMPKTKTRPKLRALRLLSPWAVLVLQNAPNRSGCELAVLSIPPSGPAQATVIRRRKLPRSMKIGLGLDVSNLGENETKERQYVLAVSGSDQSIGVYTLDYSPKKGYSAPRPYTTLRDVHPFSMTKLCFSTFTPPAHPVTAAVGPQYLKLASVSMGNTVVVHTFPLIPWPPPSRTPRYLLVKPGHPETWDTIFSSFIALLVVVLACFLLQAFTEIRGGTPPYLGATDWLSPRVRAWIARPYMFDHHIPGRVVPDITPPSPIPQIKVQDESLRKLLSARRAAGAIDLASDTAPQPPAIFVRDEGTAISAYTAQGAEALIQQETARKWEDLHEEEREKWKKRLIEAGHWAIEEGEAVLKGVFFSQIGEIIGGAIAR
ncbi:hypothetical protein C8Q69DRAFT_479441 [Paecilomyces variotii]|uniref:Guanine nucleotide-exchange factor SEC12 n=1 Tax=Byssochlamys spectabilis TaxID=264951 RepID=A0A443HL09_BYSSP|nr:hypothetical protein C8Q69DRAFT_479441 [Paecilomyces variotii]KAJ9351608.1 hypothetical protein DTO280E4_8179 [Paecilomyces variotii]RWQ92494.1 hypothetical protein C8Q69DRAFT_479441 [Paecilomyces variotii]